MMDDEKYIELLFKRADATITEVQREDLDKWLSKSEANVTKAKKVHQIWEGTGSYAREINLDLDLEFGELKKRIDRRQSANHIYSLWRPWRMAAGFVLLIGAIWFIARPGSVSKREIVLNGPTDQVLPDGSHVWLSEESKGIYDKKEGYRAFTLIGVGYFEVVKDATHPFQVRTAAGMVQVIGTAFEIDAILSDQTMVKVWEGIVKVTIPQESQSLTIKAGEGALSTTDKIVKIDFGEEPVAAWRLNPITFDKQPLAKVIEKIEEAYPITIEVANELTLTCEVTFTLSYPKVETLMTTLETLLGVAITKLGSKQYLIAGNGCE